MKELFFPYYINKGRLLDIYAILNHGYSEYEEITISSGAESQKTNKGEVSIGAGFKLFNFGGIAADEKIKTDTDGTQVTEKKIQTISSMLRIVLDMMRSKNYLLKLENADEGDFVEIDSVVFHINSIKLLMDELEEILKLYDDMKTFGDANTKKTVTNFRNISKSIRSLCNGEEVLYEDMNYAIVGNLYEEYLYQAIKTDLINTNLRCLCQIKRKHNNGATLMRNTIFSKLNTPDAKEKFIHAINEINKGGIFSSDSVAVTEITEKTVYEIEIISLYK